MKKSKLKIKNKFDFIKCAPFLILIVVVALTFGYSSLTDNLRITANVAFRVEKNVRVTNLSVNGTLNGGTVTYDSFGYKNIMSGVNLPNANSSVTLEIQVTNLGNTLMGIHEITGLPSNLDYTLDGYTLETTLCDSDNNSQCTLGSVTTFRMTIFYLENGYNSGNTSYDLNLIFDFQEMIYTAKMNGVYYETIQEAIDAAPTDGTETTIMLLQNVYQRIKIWRGNNIVLDMANLVLHNKTFTDNIGDPVVEIFGARDKNHSSSDSTSNVGSAIFKMINGTILTTANQGAVNVELGGTFIMTGGSILASGNRQAVYVKTGGTASISGSSYLRAMAEPVLTGNKTNYRATVHNAGGTLNITGGTFEAGRSDGIALTAESTTTIGVEDGTLSTSMPAFIGKNIGIYITTGTTFNFYDGVAKGGVVAINPEGEIDDVETGYDIVHSADVIDGVNYYVTHLGHGVTLTFDPDGGTQSELSRFVASGEPVGPLPEPIRGGFAFDGWYDPNDNLVGPTSTITTNTTYTAHWIDLYSNGVAQIGNTQYDNLAAAVTAVPENTETTITILCDIELSEIITIPSNKSIIVDLNDKTVDTTAGTVFTNYGILKIQDSGTNGTLTGGKVAGVQITVINNKAGGIVYVNDGTITSSKAQVIDNSGTMYITGGKISIGNFSQGVINNNVGATLNMTGGEITAPIAGSRRQAIYNKGTVNISGDAVLSSASTDRATLQNDASGASITISGGTITSTNVNCQRGAVQNGSGTLIVTGGTIISNSNYTGTASGSGPSGIQNAATCRIGVQGGGIDTTTPVIRGVNKGIYNTGTLDIYDGMLQSRGTPLSGNTRYIEANSEPVTSNTAQIDGYTYNLWYLQSTN